MKKNDIRIQVIMQIQSNSLSIIIGLVLIFLPSIMNFSYAQARDTPSIAMLTDSLMVDLHERGLFNGAVVLGIENEILYERGFGLANVAEGTPFTPGTSVYCASMAKTLIATAILMLQEEGRIHLDNFVAEYLIDFPYPKIKVRHLLEHSSGLLPDGPLLSMMAPGEEHTNELLLNLLAEHVPPLAFSPGEGFLYSGTGTIVAAILIDRLSGKSYASFLQERIFDPLGMDSTFVRQAGTDNRKVGLTPGYRMAPDGTIELFDLSKSKYGGVDFSARDLYHWVSSFYSSPLLGKAALQSGLEFPILGEEHRSGITLLNWYGHNVDHRFYFTGDSHGFYSLAYWDADRQISFVYVSNILLPNWLRPKLATALVDILEGRSPTPIIDSHYDISGIPAESWNLYAGLPHLDDFAPILGEYEITPSGNLSIENPPSNWLNIGWMLPNGWFTPLIRVNGGLRYNMFPVEPGLFYVPGLDGWVGFTNGDKGLKIHWTTVFDGTSTGTRASK